MAPAVSMHLNCIRIQKNIITYMIIYKTLMLGLDNIKDLLLQSMVPSERGKLMHPPGGKNGSLRGRKMGLHSGLQWEGRGIGLVSSRYKYLAFTIFS